MDNKTKQLSQDNIEKILNLLAQRLQLAFPEKKWKLVVCGGAALAVMNLVNRTTKDIDVIGLLEKDYIEFAEFNSIFVEQIAIVAEMFNLPKDWINTGPEAFISTGLPNGLISRLKFIIYGDNLEIGFIGRYDQIFLKLYASVDRGGYHVDDLLRLEPTEGELIDACRWVCEQDASFEFKGLLKSMLNQIGFENVTSKI